MSVPVSPIRSSDQRVSSGRRRTLGRPRHTIIVVGLTLAALASVPGVAEGSVSPGGSTTHHGRLVASSTSRRPASQVGRRGTGVPAVEAGLLPWTTTAPISRSVAVPTSPTNVLVLGGLTSGDASVATAATIAVPAGTSAPRGSLVTPTHDAAGALLRGRVLVFGGGAQKTVASVQSFPLAPPGGTSNATVVGQLPQPRADAAAVTIGRTVYVVGGYDGTRADPQVLATRDGASFRVVGSLPVPVRYPAIAAVGPLIYVFGGTRIGAGSTPVDTIQRIDTRSGQTKVVGHLPEPLSAASAAALGGIVYVAGGTNGVADSGTIEAFDPRSRHMLAAGHLLAPVSNAAVTVVGGTAWIVGGESKGVPVTAVQMFKTNSNFGVAGAPGAGSPYYGEKLLIADRGNNRLLVLDDTGSIVWTYPNPPSMPPPPGPRGFYFPDDAFFVNHGTAIISNQEENETIVKIGYPSGALLWSYGHPAQPGSAPGYLHEPDDAYLLKNGNISVADATNCRILVISPAGGVVHQVGTTGLCVHRPPTGIASPNGDTPLADGNILVSETTGSYISEYTQTGSLVWTAHVAIGYPSDPQQLGPNLYMCADYSNPGGIIEFNRSGQILYEYRATAGINRLNQPSLAELLPSGVFMVNDDYRNRMAAIDPTTQALVWDYGVPDVPGTAPGMLSIPDGFDILNPDGSTPTHPQTG